MAEPSKQLVEALKMAVAAVDKAKVPKDLRELAFKAALAGVAAKEPGDPSIEPALAFPSPRDEVAATPNTGASEDAFDKLARKLKRDVAAVKLVFDIDDDGVHLLVARNSLDEKPAAAQQEIAVLILAGRQAIGLEEWTSAKIIRDAAHDLGAYESNHAKYVGQLQGPRMRIRGKGSGRELKLNQPGFEEAATLVSRLAETT